MTNTPDFEKLAGKIAQLERSNKRTTLVLRIFIAFSIVCIVIGARPDIPEVIDAHEFNLRDKKGHVIASLMADPQSETPSLQLFSPGPNGSIRAAYGTNSLTIYGKVKKGIGPRIQVGMLDDEQPSMTIRDDQGKFRFHCGVAADNQPFFIMQNGKEKRQLFIRLSDEGLPVISLLDVDGKDRAVLSLREDGSPFFGLFKLNPKVSLGISNGKDSMAGVSFIDESGMELSSLKFDTNKKAYVKIPSDQR